ncbi:hypothetical protein BH10ACT5_BH10ACT5_18890 [soil metagenome]
MADLVVMSLERWDDVWRRNQHLVAGLLADDRTLRVLFVEPPADPMHDVMSRRRPSRGQGIAEIAEVAPGRLWRYRPVKWLPRRIDAHADERLSRAVIRATRRLGMPDPLLWINDPSAITLSMESGWRTLYDMTDDWLTADRPAAELRRVAAAETHLLNHAAEVVACSPELLRRKSPSRPADRTPITLIPNAVNTAAYRRPAPRPEDVPGSPIAVYVGTLHEDRIDVALCEQTARALGEQGVLVLVGPNALAADASERLRKAGTLLLGPRPREDVIGYLQHADVLVVPHVVTSFTDSLDPIKLYEYQAVGRPVVSTPVAGFRDADDPRITIAAGSEFVEAVRAAVSASDPAGGEPGVHVADWQDRVRAMAVVLTRLSSRRPDHTG